jgi:hypothetical protein
MTNPGLPVVADRGRSIAKNYSGEWRADGYSAEAGEPKSGRDVLEPEIELG